MTNPLIAKNRVTPVIPNSKYRVQVLASALWPWRARGRNRSQTCAHATINAATALKESMCASRSAAGRELTLASQIEHYAETRFAAHHSLISLGGALERENFIHRLHARECAEFQRVLRIYRRPGIPTLHRDATAEEHNRIHGHRPGRADHNQDAVRGETAEDRAHCLGICDGGDDDFRAAEFFEFRRRILRLTVDVMDRAEFFRERFFVFPARDRHRLESHLR